MMLSRIEVNGNIAVQIKTELTKSSLFPAMSLYESIGAKNEMIKGAYRRILKINVPEIHFAILLLDPRIDKHTNNQIYASTERKTNESTLSRDRSMFRKRNDNKLW